jgi:hypothetical protein
MIGDTLSAAVHCAVIELQYMNDIAAIRAYNEANDEPIKDALQEAWESREQKYRNMGIKNGSKMQ